ncbi:MAG TPA: biotin carboxylase N-terminal domain-containing protein [Alphaproteobacteria bacterium]|nr:biotin carboxylase N-terminal domain-containing protein [Alphaproteobacteria bacterium]
MHTVLIANRGEIACRIIRSCKALGLSTVAIHSEADAAALHVEMADAAYRVGPAQAKQSYLSIPAILAAAEASGADAVHPGYGFLAENSAFARAVAGAGLTWIGPDPDSIDDMGDKERARLLAKAAGLPVLSGSARFMSGALDGLNAAADAVGFPLLVKASAGGGGIGMRRVDGAEDLVKVVEATQTLAEKSFGDGTVYLERLVPKARHIEVQVFGFGDGRAVHMFERECSIQRRFQKIIEETPAPGLDPPRLAEMAEAAVALSSQERYRGAGTVEFVVDAQSGAFYFLEMNTRIQVEHPVTEMTTGLDLVALQIRLAGGDSLRELTQESIRRSGHAIECRLYAENPGMNFMPSPGTLNRFRLPPADRGLRIDSGVREGDAITFHYDPMIAKLAALGDNRDLAVRRLRESLSELAVEGVATNAGFLARVLDHPAFRAGNTHTGFVTEHGGALLKR